VAAGFPFRNRAKPVRRSGAGSVTQVLPCVCGHGDMAHQADDESCGTCGCLAFVPEGSHCEPLSAAEAARGVTIADRGCRASDPQEQPLVAPQLPQA